MPKSLRISIVSYHADAKKLAFTIPSMHSQLMGEDSEWHFVSNDNLGADYYRQLIPSGCDIRFYSGRGNIGFGAANNLALLDSDNEYLLIANPDIEVDKLAIGLAVRYV